jgi:hypothetical protein
MKHTGPSARPGVALCLLALLGGALACANAIENDQARQQARSTGLYSVRIANDNEKERIQGTCKFVRTINADDDPVRRPMDAELRDYLRAEAVYLGADTIYIDGRTAEAYICGPGPLNPDGTLKAPQPPPK